MMCGIQCYLMKYPFIVSGDSIVRHIFSVLSDRFGIRFNRLLQENEMNVMQ